MLPESCLVPFSQEWFIYPLHYKALTDGSISERAVLLAGSHSGNSEALLKVAMVTYLTKFFLAQFIGLSCHTGGGHSAPGNMESFRKRFYILAQIYILIQFDYGSLLGILWTS